MTPPAPACRESVRVLACQGEQAVAVLCEPSIAEPHDLGVVIIVGGPQYRAGSHRLFVHLARTLAASGTCTLRFDVRGMGDSTGAQRPFDALADDTAAAIDALLAAQPRLRHVVLWGLCDGASAALLYLHERRDPRVTALCLVNPWVRSAASLARTHVKHYYRQRLRQREFWLKLVSGRVAGVALRGLWNNLLASFGTSAPDSEACAYQTRMAHAWQRFDGPVLLVLSGDDYTAREFVEYAGSHPAWDGALARRLVRRQDIEGADHTFSDPEQRAALEAATAAWLATVH